MTPVWIAAGAAIVLLGLIVAIGARSRPEDANTRQESSSDGGNGVMFVGSVESGATCAADSADAGGGDCGGGDGGGGGD